MNKLWSAIKTSVSFAGAFLAMYLMIITMENAIYRIGMFLFLSFALMNGLINLKEFWKD